ncbi:endoribonuclease L-PSP [Streptomyces sp. WM6373]|uniref:RidA family protein n=1 Tax=Streptomyces TaxID=1883 RepID=UPI0006AF1452|nr:MULTISPECIES: RidA family protein [unclassified Streptomyces]KOU44333.1 endoribonuclease L-PSP [Streptomyces sp. WM6373]KOU79796.1 endoribonuclease L-PSP [Streptomyces sp. XY66]KOU87298.1 endoribonuclease L-PSP [Streptomyces sp. XY58]KOV07887.1 endoribonuclease L-PSP [Streptomyces sp. XY37]KOV19405.1 endoribonuclease L-PSP [Streptomyces sp. XY413]
MTRSIINPAGLHTPTEYGYSHIVSAPGEQVFIAGQYGSDESGHVVSDDFADQVERAFANLRTALAAAGLGPADVVRVGTYVVGHDERKLQVLLGHLHATWGTELPAQTLIGVAALALPGMLFEIDAVAVRTP